MTKPAEKKKFRVVGVQYNKKMTVYAADIEAAMNEMRESGYATQLQEQKDGMLLVGVHQSENPLSSFLEGMRSQGAHPAALKLGPRTKALFDRIYEASGDSWEPKAFMESVQKKMPGLLHGFNADELKTASEEFANESVAHAKTHEGEESCGLPEILVALSEMLKVAARAQLQ